MHKLFRVFLFAAVALLLLPNSGLAITVNPDGVNVRSTGPTSVFLTFRELENDQTPQEGVWCGQINQNGSCVAGTIYGTLPARNDLSQQSGQANLTDIMTIPTSVVRRAYQNAKSGGNSVFFYVRRFTSSSGASEFVPVTCRMGGGGARTPLSLIDVDVAFKGTDKAVPAVERGQLLPSFGATIKYNGSGRFKGRWEVVLPGDQQPTEFDLLPEPSLPFEQRGLQRRYTLLSRFEAFLRPTGVVYIPGPDPRKLPQRIDGLHRIILRIESTADREGNSNTGVQTVTSGGVAGFAMPSLRYYVGNQSDLDGYSINSVQLIGPLNDSTVNSTSELNFNWKEVKGASMYHVLVARGDEKVVSAYLRRGETSYSAPPWARNENAGETLRWKVIALDMDGSRLAESQWSNFSLK